jgi:hypothetical protein
MPRPDAYDREAARVASLRAELLTTLRAGLSPDDPAYVHTYGEREPTGDHLRLWTRYRDRERRDVEIVANHATAENESRYIAMYGRGAGWSSCWWCYAPPVGVAVVTDEPEGWTGWRATP